MCQKPAPPVPTRLPCATGKCPCANVEHLILVATFPGSGGEEAARLKERWEPSTLDFEAVANWEAEQAGKGCIAVKKVTTLRSWVDAIGGFPAGSLKKVSLVTHSNDNNLALSGTVSWSTGKTMLNTSLWAEDEPSNQTKANDSTLDNSGALDGALVRGSGGRGWFDNDDRGAPYAAKVRRALAKGADFNFYSCHETPTSRYPDTALLQKIARVFQVTVHGFEGFLWYQPQKVGGGKLDRTRTGFGATQSAGIASMAPGLFHNDSNFKRFYP